MSQSNKPGTAILIYDKVDNPLQESQTDACKEMVSAYTRCSLAQAPAVMLTCMAEGISLREYARTYYTIEGSSVMKSAAMLANFRTQHGGAHKPIERTAEVAHIRLIDREGEEFELRITAEEALRSRSPWIKPKAALEALAKLPDGMAFPDVLAAMREAGHLKDNWLTETDWRKMLWWRCVSEAVDAFCPEVDSGAASLSDAEMYAASDNTEPRREHYPSPSPAERSQATMERIKEAAQKPAASSVVHSATVTTNGPVPASETPPAETAPATEPSAEAEAPQLATDEQVAQLESLFERLETPKDVQQNIFARKGAEDAKGLSQAAIAEVIDKLGEMLRQKEAASEPASPS